MCKADADIPNNTQSCNRCQRRFYKVLTQGVEYLHKLDISAFNFYLICKNFQKHVFTLSFGILCQSVTKYLNLIHFKFRLQHNKMWQKSRGVNTFWRHCIPIWASVSHNIFTNWAFVIKSSTNLDYETMENKNL